MGNKNSFYLLEAFQDIPVTKAEEWLARIVVDYRRPRAGYAPRKPREKYFTFDSDPGYSNIARVLSSISSNSVKLSLLDILDISHEDLKSKANTFHSRKVERLRIHHDEVVFKKTLSYDEVDAEIKGWELNIFSPMYFIVGLLVTEDIEYHSTETIEQKNRGGVDPVKASGLLASGAPTSLLPSGKIEAADNRTHVANTKTNASGKRIFAVEYRPFRRSLRQRAGTSGKLGGYGPQGDRTFAPGELGDDDMEIVTELDSESFEDVEKFDGENVRCFNIEDTNA